MSQSRGESAFSRLPPQIHNPRHQERWYQFTGQNPQIQYRGIPVQPRTQYRRTEQAIGRRNSENFQSVSGEEFVGETLLRFYHLNVKNSFLFLSSNTKETIFFSFFRTYCVVIYKNLKTSYRLKI